MKQSATLIFHQMWRNPIKKKKKIYFLTSLSSPHRQTIPSGRLIAGSIPSPATLIHSTRAALAAFLLPPSPDPRDLGRKGAGTGRSPPQGVHHAAIPSVPDHHKMAASPHEAWPWCHCFSPSGQPCLATDKALIPLHSGKEEENEENFGQHHCHEDQEGLPTHHGTCLGQPLAGQGGFTRPCSLTLLPW